MRKQNAGAKPRASTFWLTVLAWVACVMLAALAAVLVLYSTLCRASYMKGRMRASDYAQGMYDETYEDFVSYGAGAGLSAETMTTALSEEKLASDLNEAIDRLYRGELYLHAHSEVAEDTFAAMEAEAAAKGVAVEGDTEQALVIMAEAVRLQYANAATIPLASQLFTLIQKLENYIWIALLACAVLTAAAILLLLRFGRKDPRLGVNFLLFALLSAALVCLVLGVGVNPLMRLDRMNLRPQSLKNFVVSYVEGILGRFNVFAAIYAVLAAAIYGALHFNARRSAPKRYAEEDEGDINYES